MMVHLRIFSPPHLSDKTMKLLEDSPAVCDLARIDGVATRPDGDMIICDVAREETSVLISDLRDIGLEHEGSIAIAPIETQVSAAAARAERAAPGDPGNAVVWEQVEEITKESSVLNVSFSLFMALACIIAAIGIFQDSQILIVGAMILGPEFGAIAGVCVAIVNHRPSVAWRSGIALVVGFPVGITAAYLAVLLFKATGVAPSDFNASDAFLSTIVAHPNSFTVAVALCAGVAGMLSLTTAKSATLLGVLVSVTTIPAAANIAISFAYQDWGTWRGSQLQLAINLACLIVAGTITLYIQSQLFKRRRRRHLRELAAAGAGPD